MNKGTNLISEIGKYFKENDATSTALSFKKKSGIEGKIHQLFQDTALWYEFFIPFAV